LESLPTRESVFMLALTYRPPVRAAGVINSAAFASEKVRSVKF